MQEESLDNPLVVCQEAFCGLAVFASLLVGSLWPKSTVYLLCRSQEPTSTVCTLFCTNKAMVRKRKTIVFTVVSVKGCEASRHFWLVFFPRNLLLTCLHVVREIFIIIAEISSIYYFIYPKAVSSSITTYFIRKQPDNFQDLKGLCHEIFDLQFFS